MTRLAATLIDRVTELGAAVLDVAAGRTRLPALWPPRRGNAAQNRYSRRADHYHLRSVWRVDRELPPIVIDDNCRCGRAILEHRRLGYLPPSTMTCPAYQPVAQYYGWTSWWVRPRVSTWVIRYPAWIGYLHGDLNTRARRWVDRHVRPWIAKSDVEAWQARPPYSTEAYVQRYRDEAAGLIHYHPVTPGRAQAARAGR